MQNMTARDDISEHVCIVSVLLVYLVANYSYLVIDCNRLLRQSKSSLRNFQTPDIVIFLISENERYRPPTS